MNKGVKTALIVGGTVLLVLVILSFFGGGYGWQGRGWGMMGGFGGGLWMVIFMVLIPILVIWGVVALVRGDSWHGGCHSSEPTDSALEILKRRYARGEIGKEEYEEKKRNLA